MNLDLRSVVRSFRQLRDRRRLKGRAPTTTAPFRIIDIELTNRCPLRCVMCPRTNNMTRAQGLMEFGLFQKVVDEYVRVNPKTAATEEIYLHHFGESLVHPEFEKYMKYAVSKGLYACLSVNPILLTPDVAERLLESRPAKLYVVLDGHDDASFESIRGLKNAYEKSKENLLRFLKMKTERGIKTKIMLSMIDFELNKESIARLREYWTAVPGVDEFLAKPFITWNGDAADVNKFGPPKRSNAELAKESGYASCNKPWTEISVTWDGDVIACCFDYDKKVPLGSVKDQTLTEIWNGPKMQALRREFIENKVTNPLCRDCAYLYS